MAYDEKTAKRSQYASRKAAGMCVTCGVAPARAGITMCDECAAHHKEYQRAYKKQHPEYHARTIESHRKLRKRRLDAGMCGSCGATPPEPGRARCAGCAEKHRAYAAALRAQHPERQSWYQRKHKFGLSREEWEGLFDSQGRRCAICGCSDHGAVNWHTDHDHVTGAVRGILCNGCNVGLGGFKDNALALERAARYVVAHAAPKEKAHG